MKRWLASGFFLIGTGVYAQESPLCRLQIGDDWIPMGAHDLQSCLKYAVAAADPGEIQYAEYGDTLLRVDDGEFARSIDNGDTWKLLEKPSIQIGASALSTLREDSHAQAAEDSSKTAMPALAITPTPPAAECADKSDNQLDLQQFNIETDKLTYMVLDDMDNVPTAAVIP